MERTRTIKLKGLADVCGKCGTSHEILETPTKWKCTGCGTEYRAIHNPFTPFAVQVQYVHYYDHDLKGYARRSEWRDVPQPNNPADTVLLRHPVTGQPYKP